MRITEAIANGEMGFLSEVVLGNTLLSWLGALCILLAALLLLVLLKHVFLTHLEKLAKITSSYFDDSVICFLKEIRKSFYLSAALYAAVQHLVLPGLLHLLIKGAFFLLLVYELIRLAERVLEIVVAKKMGKRTEDGETSFSSALSVILKILLWSVGLLLILSNLGFNVTSLLASLGIGGLAVSLALQPLFSDIFSSFSIILDKPFEEGDYIVCGEYKGTVKRIGLKTTRLKALQGEELVISNAELTAARVQNFKKLEKRRIAFSVGVNYDTPPAKLRKATALIEEVVTAQKNAVFNRAHFWQFGESSLNFEIVYFINSAHYEEYMDAQQDINLGILEAFAKEGIQMAFPTRTVHLVQ